MRLKKVSSPFLRCFFEKMAIISGILLASAPWLEADNRESLDYLVNQLRARLDTQELLSLSMVVLLDKDNPVLEAVHKAIKVRHGMAEVRDSISFGVPIKYAYIITSAKENSPRSRTPQPA